MAEYQVYRADEQAVEDVLARLRPQDRDEMVATSGPDYASTLHKAVEMSEHALCVYTPSSALCVFGLARPSLLSDEGVPWLIGTTVLPRYYSSLVFEARRYIAHWQETSNILFNYVDTRNRASVLWLRRLGFTIHPPAPYGVERRMFHRFEMEGLRCASPVATA